MANSSSPYSGADEKTRLILGVAQLLRSSPHPDLLFPFLPLLLFILRRRKKEIQLVAKLLSKYAAVPV